MLLYRSLPAVRLFILFQPDKGHGLILKAPRLNKPQGLRKLGESGPQKKCAVPGGQIRHRERTKLIDPHCGVMVLCRPLDFTPLVLPGGIGINDRIFFDFFTLLCIEKTACIFSKRLYSRDFTIFPMPGKWSVYSSSINFFRSCFSCFICSRSICEILFSGVGKSSGIVPPIFSIVSRTSFPTV